MRRKLERAGYYDSNNRKSPWYLWEPGGAYSAWGSPYKSPEPRPHH